MRVLIDTSVQIYRTLGKGWFKGNLDSVLAPHHPVITDYVRREFNKTAGGAFNIVKLTIQQFGASYDAGLHGPLIEQILHGLMRKARGADSYMSERQSKLVCWIIEAIVDGRRGLLSSGDLDTILLGIESWWDYVSIHTFYVFGSLHVESNGNYHKVFDCPLAAGVDSCQKGKLECGVKEILACNNFKEVMEEARIPGSGYDKQLNSRFSAKLAIPPEQDGRSIGARACFPLGDLFHLWYCRRHSCAILTSDLAMSALAGRLNLEGFLYCLRDNSFKDIKPPGRE